MSEQIETVIKCDMCGEIIEDRVPRRQAYMPRLLVEVLQSNQGNQFTSNYTSKN